MTSIIHEMARVHETTTVGEYCIIGPGAVHIRPVG